MAMEFKDWAGFVLGLGGFLLLWGGKWIANALNKSKESLQNKFEIDRLKEQMSERRSENIELRKDVDINTDRIHVMDKQVNTLIEKTRKI